MKRCTTQHASYVVHNCLDVYRGSSIKWTVYFVILHADVGAAGVRYAAAAAADLH